MCSDCLNLQKMLHNLYETIQKSRLCFCFKTAQLKDNDEDDETEILRFWVPQRSLSMQSVQSLTPPSLSYLKRGSITSASTLADDEIPNGGFKSRRHSDISRVLPGRVSEFPERSLTFRTSTILERTNSVGSIRVSLYKKELEKADEEEDNDKSEPLCEGEYSGLNDSKGDAKADNSPTEDENLAYGMLAFSTNYDENKKRLVVHLDRATDIVSKGRKRVFDTITKINLMPNVIHSTNHRSRKASLTNEIVQCSRKFKNSLNPHFHEDFYFPIERLKLLKNRVLRLSLYEYDRQGPHDAIGHALLPLSCHTKAGESVKHYLALKSPSLPGYVQNGPQLLVSLTHLPSLDRLSVGILRCRNLAIQENTKFKNLLRLSADSKLDTYAKVTLMCGGVKIKSERTNIISTNPECDPIYNQTFSFTIPLAFLEETSVVISLCLRGRLKQDNVIGRVISGPFTHSSSNKIIHWGRMLSESSRVVTEWRILYL